MPQIPEPIKLSSTLQGLQSGVLKVFTPNTPHFDSTKIVTMYSKGVLAEENLLNDPVLAGFSQQVSAQLNNAKTLMNRLGYTDVTKAPAISVNLGSLKVVPGQLKVLSYIIQRPPVAVLTDHAVEAARVAARPSAIVARPSAIVAKPPVVVANPGAMVDRNIATEQSVDHVFNLQTLNTPSFTPVSWLVNESVIIASSLDLTHTNLIIDPAVNKLTIIVETLTCGAGAQISYNDSTVWNPSPLPQTTAQSGNSYNQSNHPDGQDNGPNGGDGTGGQSGSPQTIVPPAAPSISIYALNITGMPAINVQGLKGASGNPGQNGGNGGNGAKGINGSDIAVFGVGVCRKTPGN